MKGTIVRKRDEGYGFIKPEDGSKDVFFHATAIGEGHFDDFNENDVVEFEMSEGPKGPAAANVRKAAANTNAAPSTDGDDMAEAA